MAARSSPQSAINNILDFLMFFNSGKTCPVTHEFIANKVTGANEQVLRRYNDFYLASAFVTSQENWDQSSLGDLLDVVDEMEKNYNHVGLHHKWFIIKLDIIFQIGLSILREVVDLEGDNLPEDLSGFSIPSQISVAAYRNKIVALREKYENYYTVEETGDQHAKYGQHYEQLVDGVVDNEDADKGAKKPKRGPKKAVLNKEKVYDLLDEHRVATFTDHIVKFIQSVEEKALQIPLDVGCYSAGASEPLSTTLRRLSKHHQADWTEAEAQAQGPYADQTSARKTRSKASSVATDEEELEVVATSSSSSSKDRSSTSSVQATSATKAPKEAVVEPPATRSGKVAATKPAAPKSPEFSQSPEPSAKSATASGRKGRAGTVVRDSESDVSEGKSIGAIAQKLKRKYDETDPLAEFLGQTASPAKARVSREAELPVSTKKATTSAGAAASGGKSNAKKASKGRLPVGSGDSIEFSESEDADSIEEDSDEEGSTRGSKAVAQLLHLRKNNSTASTKFPAKLETPPKSKGKPKVGAKDGKQSTVAAERANAIATGKRIKWSLEEELMLEEAVERYGEGNWASILLDPEYGQVFVGRTNVNLKDKWRNILKTKGV